MLRERLRKARSASHLGSVAIATTSSNQAFDGTANQSSDKEIPSREQSEVYQSVEDAPIAAAAGFKPDSLESPLDNSNNPIKIPLEASLEPSILSLLRDVQNSSFLSENQHEPSFGTADADLLLGGHDDLKLRLNSQLKGKSIYHLFLDDQHRKCLLCGINKTSTSRALACIRSHLDHRPFSCLGSPSGCRKCSAEKGYAEFFSKALLQDHVASQTQRFECAHEGCSSVLRRGGMKRHWDSQHKGHPFPFHLYPRYQLTEESP